MALQKFFNGTGAFYRRRRGLVNILLFFSVFMAGAVYNGLYFKKYYTKAEFYQRWFGSAAMYACGQGYVSYDYNVPESQKLVEFLLRKNKNGDYVHQIDCKDVVAAKKAPLTPIDHFYKHLILSVGTIWKYKGVAWRNVYVLAALLGAFSWLAVSLIFSMLVPPIVAVPITWALIRVTMFGSYIIHIRDYAKAPFFLFFLYFLLRLFRNLQSRRKGNFGLYSTSIILGAILGLSIGFRPDIKIMIPAFLAVSLLPLFTFKRQRLLAPILMVACMAGSYVAVGSQVLFFDKDNHANWHVIILGYFDRFNMELGLKNSTYEKLGKYNDTLLTAQITNYNVRHDSKSGMAYMAKVYDEVGQEVFLQWAKLFPYDVYVRSFASIKGIMLLPLRVSAKALGIRRIQGLLMWSGIAIAAIYLIGLNFFEALCLLGIFFYIFSFPSLQFNIRHYFHFEPLAFGFLVIPLGLFRKEFRNRLMSAFSPAKLKTTLKNTFALTACVLFAVVLVPAGLGWLQDRKVTNYITKVHSAPKKKLNVSVSRNAEGINYQLIDTLEYEAPYLTAANYLYFVFDLTQCSREKMQIHFKWDALNTYIDYSFKKTFEDIPQDLPKAVVAFPYHHIPDSRYTSLQINSENYEGCLEGLYAITDNQGLDVFAHLYLFDHLENLSLKLESYDNSEFLTGIGIRPLR